MAHEIVQAAVQLNDKSVQPSFSSPYLLSSSLRSVQLYCFGTRRPWTPPPHRVLPTAPIRRPRGADRDPTRIREDKRRLIRTPPIRTYLNFVRNRAQRARARVPLCGTRSASDWTWVARRAPTAARTLQTMMPHPPVTLNPICSLLTYSLPQARLISRGWLSSCSSDWTYRF